jgi:hypothetical protein
MSEGKRGGLRKWEIKKFGEEATWSPGDLKKKGWSASLGYPGDILTVYSMPALTMGSGSLIPDTSRLRLTWQKDGLGLLANPGWP